MKPCLPQCCSMSTYDLFRRHLPRVETTAGLVRLATAVATHELGDASAKTVEREITRYAKIVRSRVSGHQQQAMLAHLHDYLFDELGLAGNADEYYSTSNSYLPEVIESKLGLSISLAIIYKAVAEKVGLQVIGIGLPGHFLAAVETDCGRMYVDCFAGGRVMNTDECREKVESIFSDSVEWNDLLLQPVSNRLWVSRLVQNLLHIFTEAQQWDNVAAMLELQMLLWPNQSQLKRDLALVLARIDLPKPASMWLDAYLKSNPNDPEHDELTDLLAKLNQ